MLRKLLKHEFFASGRSILPMYIFVLLLGVVTRFAVNGADKYRVSSLFQVFVGLIVLLFTCSIFAVVVILIVNVVNRFKKNLMSDEGYLMLTLPTSSHKMLWSKLIVAWVWMIVTMLVILLACVILVADQKFLSEAWYEIKMNFSILATYYGLNIPLLIGQIISLSFLMYTCSCLMLYACISVSNSFTKFKSFIGLGVFIAFYVIMSLVNHFISRNGGYIYLEPENAVNMINMFFLKYSLYSVGFGAAYYMLTTCMLKYRINLE